MDSANDLVKDPASGAAVILSERKANVKKTFRCEQYNIVLTTGQYGGVTGTVHIAKMFQKEPWE